MDRKKIFFPNRPIVNILMELIRSGQSEVFEMFLMFATDPEQESEYHIIILLEYAMMPVLNNLSNDLKLYSQLKTHYFNDDIEFVLIILAYFKPKSFCTETVESMPWVNPKAFPYSWKSLINSSQS